MGLTERSCVHQAVRDHQLSLAAGFVLLGSFLFRLLHTEGLLNDHFMHLAWSAQLRAGELPVRDFVDPGNLLTYVSSAAAQIALGPTILAEALLCVGALAVAASLSFIVATRLAGSAVLGALVALLQVVIAPRLYAYPRLLVPAVALWLFWSYARHPSGRSVLVLGGWAAVAFLLRHDYGFIVGVASLVLITAVHHQSPRLVLERTGVCAGVGLALILPFLLFVQVHGGVVSYFRAGIAFADGERAIGSERQEFRRPMFGLAAPTPPMTKIAVRWAPGVDDAARTDAEILYGLQSSGPIVDRTGRYDLADDSDATVRALLSDERIEDTSGIDRSRARSQPSWQVVFSRFLARIGLARVSRVIHADNAIAWLYYAFVLMPWIGVAVLLIDRLWIGSAHWLTGETPFVAAAVALCLLTNYIFLRDPLAARLGDVSSVAPVIGVWALARVRGWPQIARTHLSRGAHLAVRVGVGAIAAVFILATGLSAADAGRFGPALATVWSGGPAGVIRDGVSRLRRLAHSPPIDIWRTGEGREELEELTRYVTECTQSSDRLLVTWFAPEVYFYSGRLFAAGQSFFHPGFFTSEADQQRAVSRLRAQTVPVVLMREPADLFRSEYPTLHDYLTREYSLAKTFDGGYAVLVSRRSRPVRADAATGLPCFRP